MTAAVSRLRIRIAAGSAILLLGTMILLAAAPAAAQMVRAVDAVGITVADMDRSVPFYRDVLGFEPVADVEIASTDFSRLVGVFGARVRMVRMRLGDEHIELIDFLAPDTGRPMPEPTRGNDRWFQHIAIVVSDMDAAFTRLREAGVQHGSTAPQTLPEWNAAAGGIEAFYFRDPDGNFLELIAFPPGKGDPRWQERGDRLFLGIDHTAIVVDDTETSLGFYRDTLGLNVAGGSENYGLEQERLNNVFGARLIITTLRAPDGPGIELLEYLAPDTGRSAPQDTRANDLWHWQIHLTVDDAFTAEGAIREGKHSFVSPGVQTLSAAATGYSQGLMVRDPDKHGIMLLQP